MPRGHRKDKPKAGRRNALADLIESHPRLPMPACSSCKRVGVVCHISSIHPDCSRCVRLGTKCNASFDLDESMSSYVVCFLLLVMTVVVKILSERVKVQRQRREQLLLELAAVTTSLSRDEGKIQEAVAREVEILNAWDAADFNHSLISVPVSSDMVADFVGEAEDGWASWLVSPVVDGPEGTGSAEFGSSSNL